MKARYFWLYSDHKTVKEISWDEWKTIVNKDFHSQISRLVCRVDDSEVYLRKGSESIWIPKNQLKAVLGDE